MEPRTQERVERWDSRPFSGGYDGLSDLADADFSGAVAAAGTWLFMLNGRVVGVVDGAIEDFEAASGTRYEAPDPALPLLCTMEEHGGETRAKYYTNETPLREVDETLQSGSFTGYVELSENVLSGDYYAVYYGGRRMAAAYIGNADRLLTGDEAFERAADEVGIYEVRDVEIEVTDVPGTGADSSDAGGTTDTAADGSSPATEPDPATADGTRAEPSTDPTESAIDSIDITESKSDSGSAETEIEADGTASAPLEDVAIGDASIDDIATDAADGEASTDPSGITATDEGTLDSDPASNGITDAEPTEAAESVGAVDDRSTAEPADAGVGEEQTDATELVHSERTDSTDATDSGDEPDPVDAATAADPVGSTERPAAEPDRPSSDDRTQPSATEARGETVEYDERTSTSDDESETDTDSEAGSTAGSGPDLAEVEAAAQQLEQNDISWTEEDVAESAADGDSAAADAGATADAPTAADTAEPATSGPEPTGATAAATSESEPDGSEATDERFDQEAQWRETRSIPSIDPDNSQSADSSRASGRSETTQQARTRREAEADTDRNGQRRQASGESTRQQSTRRQRETDAARQRRPQRAERSDAAGAGSGSDAGPASGEPSGAGASDDRVAELEARVETLEEQRDELVAAAEELEAERDRLQSENEELSSTIDRLRSRIEELEAELERAREADAGDAESTPSASTQLSPDRALAETNLFVRYASKSQPTLESAHGGESDRSDVAANLRLEHHTGFDAADAAVDGRPYEEFLAGTMEHRFVDWLTDTVLFEIRDTGNADGLGDLYDAIPQIDRAELDATISLRDDETEDVPDQVRFDVVAFDKMGNPLLVANLNDSREPATQDMLEEMEEAASAVKANYPDLAAAVVVTSSYFEPGALEVAERATSGGLLSRGSKLSYVNLSRKQGYHLCLVESRSEGFHVNVPEL
ncbi:transcriptional regulator [Haloterrigena salinisoli]|uniref:DUF7527 domain-containing protein n=1 Tax=Haloterrigena salinisoli TaxID=3132747 RepID=UPI0030CB07DB